MPAPYLTKAIWPDFTIAEVTHSFSHLQEVCFDVTDSSATNRQVIATFSDHVFTRDAEDGDDQATVFPLCDGKKAPTVNETIGPPRPATAL
jgi:hypothetical protein